MTVCYVCLFGCLFGKEADMKSLACLVSPQVDKKSAPQLSIVRNCAVVIVPCGWRFGLVEVVYLQVHTGLAESNALRTSPFSLSPCQKQ